MNRSLRPDIRANRSMTKTRFDREEPLDVLGERIEKNLEDLVDILEWNVNNDILFYRISSNLVPLKSLFELTDLPNSRRISRIGREAGNLIKENDIRISFHPDHFVKLASPTDSVVESSVREIEEHAHIMNDLLGLPKSFRYPINIHIGAHYQNKQETGERFVEAYNKELSDLAKSYLVVENDDSSNLWSVSELVDISEDCGIPVTFDYHHHCFSGELPPEVALSKAISTWPEGVTPITHYSEPARLHDEENNTKPQKHSYLVSDIHMTGSEDVDVMLEANGKEKAVLDLADRGKL